MNDSTFAVGVFLVFVGLAAVFGAVIMWEVMQGPRECSVTLEYAGGHKVEYLTECEVG
jgi:hypothetical protein